MRTHLPVDPTRRYFEHSRAVGELVPRPDHAHARDPRRRVRDARVRAGHAARPEPGRGVRARAARAAVPLAAEHHARSDLGDAAVPAAVFPILVLAAFGVLCVLAERRSRSARDRRAPGVAVVLGVLRGRVSGVHDQERLADDGAARLPDGRARTCAGSSVERARSSCRRKPRRYVAVRPADLALVLQCSGGDHVVGPEVGVVDPPARRQARSRGCCGRSRASGREQHRKLFLVAGNAQTIRKLFPGAVVRIVPGQVNLHLLVQTLVSRPDAFQTERLSFAIARVPTRVVAEARRPPNRRA